MVRLTYTLVAIFFMFYLGFRSKYSTEVIIIKTKTTEHIVYRTSPPSIRLYDAIKKYSNTYNVPLRYAYGIAFCETRYQGAFDWFYIPSQTSSVGAVGPMQVMYPTAKMMWPGLVFTEDSLKNNIEFNVETSMKCLKHLQKELKLILQIIFRPLAKAKMLTKYQMRD